MAEEPGIEEEAFQNIAQGLEDPYRQVLIDYWQRTIDNIERIGEGGSEDMQEAFKATALPLARIKKVMKTDTEVRMISAEAPILFAKGCDIFITELTMRAWIHAEENKRRTLQRSDIATALQKSDVFDFLIDIVPREEAQPRRFYGDAAQDISQIADMPDELSEGNSGEHLMNGKDGESEEAVEASEAPGGAEDSCDVSVTAEAPGLARRVTSGQMSGIENDFDVKSEVDFTYAEYSDPVDVNVGYRQGY